MIFPTNLRYVSFICGMRLSKITSGVPANPKIVAAWLKVKLSDKTDDAQQKAILLNTIAETFPLEVAAMAEMSDIEREKAMDVLIEELTTTMSGTVFKRDSQGYACVEGRQVKSGLKENAGISFRSEKFGSVRKITKAKAAKIDKKTKAVLEEAVEAKETDVGGKGLIAVVAERVFIPDHLIRLTDKDGAPIEIIRETRPIHVKDMRGNRVNALKTYEFAEDAYIEFEVRVDNQVFEEFESRRVLKEIMTSFQMNGLGADRSQGSGMFEVVRWDRANEQTRVLNGVQAVRFDHQN